MDKVIFGDNQFFGVNHLSEEKARQQMKKFKDIKNILRVLDDVNDMGIKTFMVTTYESVEQICDHVRINSDQYKDFKINPCLPYAHKYANSVAAMGIFGTLKKYLKGNIVQSISKGGVALARKDFEKIMEILIDAELSIFKGVTVEAVFLQNVVTDLLLGLGMFDFFEAFVRYVENRYKVRAGFITMNMPMLYDVLESRGISNPVICSSINKINFRMSGGIEQYKTYLAEKEFHAIAMQVLAAGALRPKEAMEFIGSLEGVDSVLFGSSTKEHILDTKLLIEQYL
ncbi:hypothetical protein OOT00_13840 [Desulfobotulus sp. H1]|uniref:Uncharacterized protein n=1 Tax=Desulfobotulus pelophilus TaxID=2823377 RepID=A0ABT3NC77_9BACT|nr:hypothetical protein [Desulfobotulus pelophilus]MCW7755066.1 hypothetical protein [Desulfobotulus pelophilus]